MSAAPEEAAVRPGGERRRWRTALWTVGLLFVVLVGALAGGAGWLLGSTGGARWLLGQVPGVQAEGVSGRLIGPALAVERLVVRWDPQGVATVERFNITGLDWSWRPAPGAWIGLQAQRLGAERIVVQTGPPAPKATTPPPALPDTLRLPLQLDIAALQAGEIRVDQQPPLRDLSLRLRLGAEHRIDALGFAWDQLRLSGGALRVAADPPFALQGALSAGGGGPLPWQAALKLDGQLDRVAVAANLRGEAGAGQAAPAFDLKSELAPFRAWPLLSLSASTAALDLRSLVSALPQTRLAGRVDVQSSGAEAPIGVSLDLKNALAGPWDGGRLPLAGVALKLNADLRQRDRIGLPSFDLALGDAGSAGRWRGSGSWNGTVLTLDTRIESLQPQRLHGAAPVMQLSGPLTIRLRGLPSPADPAPRFDPKALTLDLEGAIDGRIDGAPQPVRLEFDASGGLARLELRKLLAVAGAATAQLQLDAAQAANGGWQLRGTAELNRFDHLPWWPGTDHAPWRRGPHRLSASGRFDLQLPPDAPTLAPLALAARIAGSARLQVRDALVAGVPLQANFEFGADGNAATPGQVRADAVLGGNRLGLSGRVDPFGDGAGDRLSVELDAPDIGTLAPLARLLPALAEALPRRGRVEIRAEALGRWPALRSSGSAKAGNLQVGEIGLGRLQADWKVATVAGEALSLQAELEALQSGTQRVDRLRADLQGTPAQHRLRLSGALPLVPPPALARLLGLPGGGAATAGVGAAGAPAAAGAAAASPPARPTSTTASAADRSTGAARTPLAVATAAPPAQAAGAAGAGMQADLVVDGQWTTAAAGGGSWRGSATQLVVRPLGGTAAGATASAAAANGWAWIDASGLQAELQLGAGNAPRSATLEPGRARLAGGAFTLAWQQAAVDLTGAQPAITLRAAIEPFAVAPLLARAQPAMGWGGDLRLRARVELQAAQRFDADIVVERALGDLYIGADPGSSSAPVTLGLSELRLGLAAHDGEWIFTQAAAGRTLGEMSGAVRARTTPAQRLPPADAPIDGVVEMRVANLGVWGTWVPPGWRLAGTLHTSATLAGTFGAPEYGGQIRGSGIGVRNPLQGVDVRDGVVAITLKGESAVIETFKLRGGDGTLEITGGASFGAAPKAALHFKAQQLRLLGRIDRRIVASGDADLALGIDLLRLDGKFRVDEGLFDVGRADAPSLDEDVVVLRAGQQRAPPVPESTGPRREMRVAIDLDLGEKLRVRGRGLDTTLRGQLRLTTPGGQLRIHGSVRTDRGTYAAYGQKLVIERGIISFSGPPAGPQLDVLALRKTLDDSRVGVAVSGSVLVPRIRLYSEPEMSETDKLSWLVLGRASSGLGRNDTALLQSAALGLLAGEGEGKSDALLRQLGIDEFSVRQTDGETKDTVIAIGKQISDRLYVGYERGVNAASGSFQLIYRVAQRFTLRAQSGQDSALDLIWTWRVK